MKTSRLFTIDVELAERLSQTNASKLINTLLKEYFEVRSDKNTLLSEKNAVLEQISKKKKQSLRIFALLKSFKLSILIIFRKLGLRHAMKSLQKEKLLRICKDEKAKYL